MRIETIGDCTLLDLPFLNHMARLAKANKIREHVCLVRAGEAPERDNMVDGNPAADMFFAPLARFAVPRYRFGARINPSFSSIRSNTTDVIGCICAGLTRSFISPVAILATKTFARPCFVLALNPRLHAKIIAAVSTSLVNVCHHIYCGGLLRGKSVSRPKSFAPFVAFFVLVRHLPCLHVPFAAARLATKSSGCGPVGLNNKSFRANLASFFDHLQIIPRTMGVAKHFNIACKRIREAYAQPDMFAEPPKQMKQDTLL